MREWVRSFLIAFGFVQMPEFNPEPQITQQSWVRIFCGDCETVQMMSVTGACDKCGSHSFVHAARSRSH